MNFLINGIVEASTFSYQLRYLLFKYNVVY